MKKELGEYYNENLLNKMYEMGDNEYKITLEETKRNERIQNGGINGFIKYLYKCVNKN